MIVGPIAQPQYPKENGSILISTPVGGCAAALSVQLGVRRRPPRGGDSACRAVGDRDILELPNGFIALRLLQGTESCGKEGQLSWIWTSEWANGAEGTIAYRRNWVGCPLHYRRDTPEAVRCRDMGVKIERDVSERTLGVLFWSKSVKWNDCLNLISL